MAISVGDTMPEGAFGLMTEAGPTTLPTSELFAGKKVVLAVNDVFVMHAWGKDQGVGDKILMLADGNGDYARALGLDTDSSPWGMGIRSQRFVIIAEDGIVTHLAIEEPACFDVTKAETILQAL